MFGNVYGRRQNVIPFHRKEEAAPAVERLTTLLFPFGYSSPLFQRGDVALLVWSPKDEEISQQILRPYQRLERPQIFGAVSLPHLLREQVLDKRINEVLKPYTVGQTGQSLPQRWQFWQLKEETVVELERLAVGMLVPKYVQWEQPAPPPPHLPTVLRLEPTERNVPAFLLVYSAYGNWQPVTIQAYLPPRRFDDTVTPFDPQIYTADAYVNITPTANAKANITPTADANSQPTPAEEAKIG